MTTERNCSENSVRKLPQCHWSRTFRSPTANTECIASPAPILSVKNAGHINLLRIIVLNPLGTKLYFLLLKMERFLVGKFIETCIDRLNFRNHLESKLIYLRVLLLGYGVGLVLFPSFSHLRERCTSYVLICI